MKTLVTGAAGFIGFHLCQRLLKEGHDVYGVDNLNDYYDVELKRQRLAILKEHRQFTFYKVDLKNIELLELPARHQSFDYVVHLAAQAGVRYSIENPHAYVESNLSGFVNVLEFIRKYPVKHFLYASSSSVYGGNQVVPFSTEAHVDHPVSLYAATKKSNELLAHSYSHLYNIPSTGLRFFTVYGPYGRPDMAYFSFAQKIMSGQPIQLFNHGEMERDFTYIDDIVEGIYRLLPLAPQPNPDWREGENKTSESFAPYRVYNIGNHSPVALETFVNTLETALGQKAVREYLPMQPGDVERTYADVSELEKAIGFKPSTSLADGLGAFATWFKSYYRES